MKVRNGDLQISCFRAFPCISIQPADTNPSKDYTHKGVKEPDYSNYEALKDSMVIVPLKHQQHVSAQESGSMWNRHHQTAVTSMFEQKQEVWSQCIFITDVRPVHWQASVAWLRTTTKTHTQTNKYLESMASRKGSVWSQHIQFAN